MDLEDFNRICKIPYWGSLNDPPKSLVRDFFSGITVGETRDITQATIGSIHFPAIHYFALLIGRLLTVRMKHVTCVSLISAFSGVLC